MKKKLTLNKKTVKNLKLKLKPISQRKAAPLVLNDVEYVRSNGMSC